MRGKRVILLALLLVNALVFLAPPVKHHAVTSSRQGTTWWNANFPYRIPVNLTEPGIVERTDFPVDIFVKFNPPAHPNSIRVVYNNHEIKSQVWNETYNDDGLVTSATVTILVNMSVNESRETWIYYSPSDTGAPSYPRDVSWEYVSNGIRFYGATYWYVQTYDPSGGRFYWLYGNDGRGYGAGQSNGVNWNPDRAYSPSVAGHPPVSNGIVEDGPIFVTYYTYMTLGTSPIYAYVNTTYRIFKWGWITTTNMSFTQTETHNYRMNEWVFGRSTGGDWMDMAIWKYSGSIGSYTTTGNTYKTVAESGTEFVALYKTTTGFGVGSIMLGVIRNVTTGSAYYTLYLRSSYYDFWHHFIYSIQTHPDWWIFEKYVIYVWNGSGKSPVYAPLAAMNDAFQNPLNITIGSTEIKSYPVEISVIDAEGNPLEGALVQLINNSDGTIAYSEYADANGHVLFPAVDAFYNSLYTVNVTYNASHTLFENSSQTINLTGPVSLTVRVNIVKLTVKAYNNDTTIILQGATVYMNDTYYEDTDAYGVAILWLPPNSQPYNMTLKWRGIFRKMNSTPTEDPINDYILISVSTAKDIVVRTNVIVAPPSTEFSIHSYNYLPLVYGENLSMTVWLHSGNTGITTNNNNITVRILRENTPVITMQKDTSNGYVSVNLNTTVLGVYGTYVIEWSASLDPNQYQQPAPLRVTFIVNPIPTNYSVSLTTTVYYNESFSLEFSYNDKRTNTPIQGATVKVTIINTEYKDVDISSTYHNGKYTFNISRMNLMPGTYSMFVRAEMPNHENVTTLPLQFTVLPRPLQLQLNVTNVKLYWKDTYTLYVRCYDERSGESPPAPPLLYVLELENYTPVIDVSLTYADGFYIYTINTTGLKPGTYVGRVILSALNATTRTMDFTLHILQIPIQVAAPEKVEKNVWDYFGLNEKLTIRVNVSDIHNNISLENATVIGELIFKDGTHKNYTLVPVGDGLYALTLNVKDIGIGSYTMKVYVIKENYVAETRVLQITINYAGGTTYLGGSPVPTVLLLVGIISGVGVSVFAAYRVVLYLKTPPEVREINKYLKELEKDRIPELPLAEREEVMEKHATETVITPVKELLDAFHKKASGEEVKESA